MTSTATLPVLEPVALTPAGWLEAPSLPATGRARLRLVLLLLAAGAWAAPWLGAATGAERTGAAGALAWLAAWGTGTTLLLARTGRGLRAGEAATSSLLALLVLALVLTRHPWLPGPDRRATWTPLWAGLLALGLLDGLALARRWPVGLGIAVLRTAAALVAASSLLLLAQWLPAAVAAWLFVAPAATAFSGEARDARRALEVLGLVAAVALFLAPELAQTLTPMGPSVEVPTLWAFLWRLLGVALAVVALRGSLWPQPEAAASPPSSA